VTEPILPVRHVCSANELQQARAACNQPDSASCQAYFAFEQQTNAACASCLAPFDVSFNDATGILLCIAPFVDSTCDRAMGCFADCQTKSCAGCTDASSRAQCENDVQNNQCSSFAAALDCVAQSLFGGAATFCDPQNYPTFGGWLQGVGGHFCGP